MCQLPNELGLAKVELTRKRKYEEYRKAWEDNPKTFKIGNFPLHLDIESTNQLRGNQNEHRHKISRWIFSCYCTHMGNFLSCCKYLHKDARRV